MHAVPAAGYGPPPGGAALSARAAALCDLAAAAIANPPPADEIRMLAEQLADVGRLLGRAARAGTIAAAAYEAGRLDERERQPPAGRLRCLPGG